MKPSGARFLNAYKGLACFLYKKRNKVETMKKMSGKFVRGLLVLSIVGLFAWHCEAAENVKSALIGQWHTLESNVAFSAGIIPFTRI